MIIVEMSHLSEKEIKGRHFCWTDKFGLLPSGEFELTANLLGAHIETHTKLILRTLSYK